MEMPGLSSKGVPSRGVRKVDVGRSSGGTDPQAGARCPDPVSAHVIPCVFPSCRRKEATRKGTCPNIPSPMIAHRGA